MNKMVATILRGVTAVRRTVANLGRGTKLRATAVIMAVLFGVTALASGDWLSAGAAYFGIWIIWSVNAWPEQVREAGPYAAVFGGLVPVFILRGKHVDREFFVLAAEVIPLLFLAMVAGKSFSLIDKQEPDRRIRTLTVYFLILGEGFSLYVLATRDQSSGALGWSVGALVAAAVSIISAAVGGGDGGAGPAG